MGVPGFFSWLLKKYENSNIISENINCIVDNLYLDANCLFHPQCFKVLSHYNKKKSNITIDALESGMMKRIISYMDFLINYVKPKNKIFIAVDGVAPLAKMNQQRKRRFKSVYDNKLKEEIDAKYNKQAYIKWSNSVITPGTKFMERLHNKIIEWINAKKFKQQIIYSSYHTIGEGEHKILQDIKKTNNKNNNASVIYGLDADLIFLALSSGKKNIFLLREEMFLKKNQRHQENKDAINVITDVAEPLNFVSIDITKNHINEYVSQYTHNKICYVNDFIIICFLLGNDFIPNLPSIEIKNGGIDFLIDIYIKTANYTHASLSYYENNKLQLNGIFLIEFLKNISRGEDYYFTNIFPSYLKRMDNRKYNTTKDEYEQEIWELENMKKFNIKYLSENDKVQLGKGKRDIYKFRFYEYYYGSVHNQTTQIHNMCIEYIKGILWIIEYYFNECCSYNWQYEFNHAPFASDLYTYISNYSNIDELINSQTYFNKTNIEIAITPFIQLLSVLSPLQNNMLPYKYANLMIDPHSPIIDLFPTKVKMDILYKDNLHKCSPLIPNIDVIRIAESVKNIALNAEEKQRNTITHELKF